MSNERIGWKSPNDLADALGISRRAIYNWLAAGKLRYERTIGGPIKIDPSSVWADDVGPRTPWVTDPSRTELARPAAAEFPGDLFDMMRRVSERDDARKAEGR